MLHNMQHSHITNGGTTEHAYIDTLLLLKAKLTLTNKGLHDFRKNATCFVACKNAAYQSSTSYRA
jgi:hypothetical protein